MAQPASSPSSATGSCCREFPMPAYPWLWRLHLHGDLRAELCLSACLVLTFGAFSRASTGWFVGPCCVDCPHDVRHPLGRAVSQQEGPCPVTSCQVSSLPSSQPLSAWFRGVCEFRTSQPTPKIVVWEATVWGALRNHISATTGLTLRSRQPSLGGSWDPRAQIPPAIVAPRCKALQTGQAQTRETEGSHTEEERPRLQSSDRCFSSSVEMQVGMEELCLGEDEQFGAEICPRLVGYSRWEESPHPQFLSSVLWEKMRWEPQETFFGVGGGNCRWQTCVEHMCKRCCSPARNYPLSFLSSHVSRSVSPTTTSQIQARKKRRGVSVLYDDQGNSVPWSGWPCEPTLGPSFLLKSPLHCSCPTSCRTLPKPNFFPRDLASNLAEKGRAIPPGLITPVHVSSLNLCTPKHSPTQPFQSTWRALDL